MKSAKRIMVTLRCEACGVDLSIRDNDRPALLQVDTGAVLCTPACVSTWNVRKLARTVVPNRAVRPNT